MRTTPEHKLLTPQELAACLKIAAQGTIHGKRAAALLAVNDGSTRAHAAEQAGLSPGQVKYALTRFRELGLGVFPGVQGEVSVEKPEAAPTGAIELSPKPKKKKAKPSRGKKKGKKAKKDKKPGTKKGKKTGKSKKKIKEKKPRKKKKSKKK